MALLGTSLTSSLIASVMEELDVVLPRPNESLQVWRSLVDYGFGNSIRTHHSERTGFRGLPEVTLSPGNLVGSLRTFYKMD